ncbi:MULTISPECIES: phosphatase PAP2 family protein [unclassified Arthrobacter]|uniref:phosphatase PAP2 family protein n=1 Tax=unclassified Arthrobacter TaxID=235627 RepID=UPI00159DC954|nr:MULTISPECIES: phosphatase PAP2 family protein [unclassified Arthrobacter]MCQ9165570.1 phosphatase PAP2 family protein [Arthrobacter sp. STN4]NVN00629.1 phosphatase PAP2 family protein [Arthrobacter sp. SDTb3-6]
MAGHGTTDGSRYSRWHGKFVVEERHLAPEARHRLQVTAGVLIGVGLAAFLFLLISVLTHTGFQRLDEPVETWFRTLRSPGLTAVMIGLAVIFGPIALPIIVLVVVVAWAIAARHAWRPFLLAAGMVTGVILAGGLAPLVRHPRPPVDLMLFGADHSYSFPSGHVLGTADFLLLLAFLIASRRQRTGFTVGAFTIAIIGIAIQIASRLYLGYHWISDTTASVALSMVVVGVVIAIDTHRTVLDPGEQPQGPYSQLQVDGS